jgi:hypothetical protein
LTEIFDRDLIRKNEEPSGCLTFDPAKRTQITSIAASPPNVKIPIKIPPEKKSGPEKRKPKGRKKKFKNSKFREVFSQFRVDIRSFG